MNYCPTVEKTEKIQAALENNVLDRVQDYLSEIGKINADRALQWAYLSETESSYAIEGEKPDMSKSARFVRLLEPVNANTPLTDVYLCDLQNHVISNPSVMSFSYRTEHS